MTTNRCYDIDADPNGIRADVIRCVRAAMYCGANNVNPPPEGHWLRDFWLIGRAEAQPTADRFIATFRCEDGGVVGYTDAPVHSVSVHDDGVVEVVIDHWPEQPASVGEEIMVNAGHDVFILPLQPSGLSSGPRFVVHVPGQPASPQRRPYNASGSLSEYGIFPECDAAPAAQTPRACTCHPDDRPDGPCRERYAASECQALAAVDEAMVERIAALLYEEATDDPWIVAGIEHPEPDRDYYRGLASKVAALAAQPGGAE